MHLWALTGAGGWVAQRGFQAQPWCWFTTLLCKSKRHFLLSAPLLIRSISTSPLRFWSYFPPNDFSPTITPPRVSPSVTQPWLVLSVQHRRKQIFALVGWDQTGHRMFLVLGSTLERTQTEPHFITKWKVIGEVAQGEGFFETWENLQTLCWDIPGISSEITQGGVQGTKPQKLA